MTSVELRLYDPARDRKATHRIWREVGWIGKDESEAEAMDYYVACGRALVGTYDGEAECLVLAAPGRMRYLDDDVSLSCITGVTTSRVIRKQGIASRLVAKIIAEEAAEGAMLSGLGMFEQGYYNQFGYGSGGYETRIAFDPAHLEVPSKPRVPSRLTADDWQEVHASRLLRRRAHGGCNLLPAAITRAEMTGDGEDFGLGYRDGEHGELTHYFWCSAKEVEHGPYTIRWMVYQTPEQLLELLSLLKSLGDQVRLVRMMEPPGIQLQDLIRQPFRHMRVTDRSRYEAKIEALAYWQMRICDLKGCLERTHLCGETLRFNLTLDDPIERFLDETAPWKSLTGEYVVTLGETSGVEQGTDSALPTLKASVGAFTRMWLGVLSASGLAITDSLSAPSELLDRLDRTLRLPQPHPDWDF
jgi:predicted acetyltransferase